MIGLFFIMVSCRITRDGDQTSVSFDWLAGLREKAGNKSDPQGRFIRLLQKRRPDQPGALVAEFNTDSCLEGKHQGNQVWRVYIESAFGAYSTVVTMLDGSSPHTATAEIDRVTYNLKLPTAPSQSLADQLCASASKDLPDVADDYSNLVASIEVWLRTLAPDCSFNFQNNQSWFCELDTAQASDVSNELDDMRRVMIRRWNRQPYILTRRLAIARNLAGALESPRPQEALDSLCKIALASSSAELPLSLASSRWQETVCRKPTQIRLQAARIGLTKALSEIELLRRVFESTSRMGYLSLQVPRDVAPSRDLWVSLEPLQDVSEKIAVVSTKLVQSDDSSKTSTVQQDGCWHPLFGEGLVNMLIARQLDMVGSPTKDTQCQDAKQASDNIRSQVLNYFADSITSETEFVITNGNGKLLRLPPGTYQYTIRQHNNDLSELDALDSMPSSTGSVTWTEHRPRATIDRW